MEEHDPPCQDVLPPRNFNHPTCASQFSNTENCARRVVGTLKDGYCHKTCGVCTCKDVPPPSSWTHNTCAKQLEKTQNCEKRRAGLLNDGYCYKTCGVCKEGEPPCYDRQPSEEHLLGPLGTDACPSGTEAVSEDECTDAAIAAGLEAGYEIKHTSTLRVGTWSWTPKGCSISTQSNNIVFRTGATGANNGKYAMVCKRSASSCAEQLANTNKCAQRRRGTLRDGYCHKTCGVCSTYDYEAGRSNLCAYYQKRGECDVWGEYCASTCGVCAQNALLTLYEALGGAEWKSNLNWIGPAGTDECSFEGVSCSKPIIDYGTHSYVELSQQGCQPTGQAWLKYKNSDPQFCAKMCLERGQTCADHPAPREAQVADCRPLHARAHPCNSLQVPYAIRRQRLPLFRRVFGPSD